MSGRLRQPLSDPLTLRSAVWAAAYGSAFAQAYQTNGSRIRADRIATAIANAAIEKLDAAARAEGPLGRVGPYYPEQK